MDVSKVAELVTFILPGYVAIQLRDFLVRSKKRDNFERFATSLLISLGAYVCAQGVVFAIHRGGWREHTTVRLENLPFLLLVFALAAGAGYVNARLIMSIWLQQRLYRHGLDLGEHPNVWNEIWNCPNEAPWVLVRMKDGAECWGKVRAYSVDPNDHERELWLNPVAQATNGEPALQEIPGLSVYIPGDQIACVSAYRPQDADPDAVQRS